MYIIIVIGTTYYYYGTRTYFGGSPICRRSDYYIVKRHIKKVGKLCRMEYIIYQNVAM